MASVDEVKDGIEDAIPGRSRRRRRLPVALLLAGIAGVAAFASRLEPVRSAVGSGMGGLRSRVASIRGGDSGQGDAEGWRGAAAAGTAPSLTETSSSDTTASELAATDAAVDPTATGDATGGADTAADAPVGIGLDDAGASAASPETIPADTEDGRPAGV